MASNSLHMANKGGQRNTTPALAALLTTAVFALPSCRLTDHSERDPAEITPDVLSFPSSGYQDVDPGQLPRMSFTYTHLDLGRIVQGTKVDSTYILVNTGGSPLVITDVRGSCGCTVGKDWPKAPVAPGDQAIISVSFDSEGRSGRQEKTVTVVANTSPPSTVLTLSAEVIGPTSNP